MARSFLWMVIIILLLLLYLFWFGIIDVGALQSGPGFISDWNFREEPPPLDWHISRADIVREEFGVVNLKDVQLMAALVGKCVSEDVYSGCVPTSLDLVPDGEINVLDVQEVMRHLGCNYWDDCYWMPPLGENKNGIFASKD